MDDEQENRRYAAADNDYDGAQAPLDLPFNLSVTRRQMC